ncbi:hypothetical protein KEM52_006576 [Ascosphaera acerosa]|nr:hypothetical protein KEM52_006576 [Ascosphaera acerosa]
MPAPLRKPLPIADEWDSTDAYIDSLLAFATSSELFRTFAGGIHILDFLTREPDLYTTVLPADWRAFFDEHTIADILDLLLREPVDPFLGGNPHHDGRQTQTYRGRLAPPPSLADYILQIRRHSLRREFHACAESAGRARTATVPPHVAIGMKPKKKHEVENFAHFVDDFADVVRTARGEPVSHIVDFGSGQNYLGRMLASPPYNRRIIAIERKHHNINGAIGKDAHAKLKLKKQGQQQTRKQNQNHHTDAPHGVPEQAPRVLDVDERHQPTAVLVGTETPGAGEPIAPAAAQASTDRLGSVDYIEHDIQDGYLEPIIQHIVNPPASESEPETQPGGVMVISLHSCGNLVHHGIRSFVLNPSVVAIAMIGCCYNLMTERLGPVTYKLPALRSMHPRLAATSTAYDPHGFPMSKTMENYEHEGGRGIKCNITARMMAVQAPFNWGPEESEGFFTRHFYRALLQRVLVDYGIIPVPVVASAATAAPGEAQEDLARPLIVGSLRKPSMASFVTYARAALAKLERDDHYGAAIRQKLGDISETRLQQYAEEYADKKKALSIIWSLMAFSASIVESIVVTDRWLFLCEQKDLVKEAWVQPVFDYAWSPRNLAVIGIKK